MTRTRLIQDAENILSETGFNEFIKNEWIYEIPSTERWVQVKLSEDSEMVQINFNDESNIVISIKALIKGLFMSENL